MDSVTRKLDVKLEEFLHSDRKDELTAKMLKKQVRKLITELEKNIKNLLAQEKSLAARKRELREYKAQLEESFGVKAAKKTKSHKRRIPPTVRKMGEIAEAVAAELKTRYGLTVADREIEDAVRELADQKPTLKFSRAVGYYHGDIEKEVIAALTITRDSNYVIHACGIKNRYYLGKLLDYIIYRSEEPQFKDKAIVQHLKTYKNSKDSKPHYYFSDAMIDEIKEFLAFYVKHHGGAIIGDTAKP